MDDVTDDVTGAANDNDVNADAGVYGNGGGDADDNATMATTIKRATTIPRLMANDADGDGDAAAYDDGGGTCEDDGYHYA